MSLITEQQNNWHCRKCGNLMARKIPNHDTHQRWCCPSCGYIDYQNPLPVVGVIIYNIETNKILLAERGIEPRKHYWTYPAGFQELNESLMTGALRECREEAGIVDLINVRLFSIASILTTNQSHTTFVGETRSEALFEFDFETLQTKWFKFDEIENEKLAFPIIKENLDLFFADLSSNRQSVHYLELSRDKTTKRIMY